MVTTVVPIKDDVSIKLGTFWDVNGNPTVKNQKILEWNNVLTSENHPGWRKARLHEDRGGPFEIIKREIHRYPSDYFEVNSFPGSGSLGKEGYRGYIQVSEVPAAPSEIPIDFNYWGPIAYKRMKPTKPSFNALTSLAELRDLPGLLKSRFTPDLKGAANGHLAVQFGWLPLIGDIRKLVKAQMGLQKRIDWLLKNEGRPIRTRVHLETFSNVSDPTYEVKSPYLFGTVGPTTSRFSTAQQWKMTRWTSETRLVWASAQFRFWLPPGPRDINWTNAMKRKIFGLYASPSQVYAAVPWSWLIDWFSSAGDVLENLEAGIADRLAADRFYIMGTQTRSNYSELSLTIKDSDWGDQKAVVTRSERHFVSKKRVRGNPFGFNVAQSSLSAMQLSILGALGYSRLS